MYSELLSLPTLDLRRTGPVNISISRLLLSIAYSALLLQDGKLQLLFTPASPQVIKLYPRTRAVTSLGDQNSHLHRNLMRPPSHTVHYWPKRCYALRHIIYFCPALNWGDTGAEEKESISLFFARHCEYFVTIPKINTILSWSHNYFVIEKAY